MTPSSPSQAALGWWQHRLSTTARQQADRLRDGELQDIFVLRRSLEQCLQHEQLPTAEKLQDWLQQLENLYQSLEQLGDQMSPPQWDDLSLAVQHCLHLWQTQHRTLIVTAQYQAIPGGCQDNDIVLWALGEWLRITAGFLHLPLPAYHLRVWLSSIHHPGELHPGELHPEELRQGELRLQLDGVDFLGHFSDEGQRELGYLQQMFSSLIQGGSFEISAIYPDPQDLEIPQGLGCIFRWPLEKAFTLEYREEEYRKQESSEYRTGQIGPI